MFVEDIASEPAVAFVFARTAAGEAVEDVETNAAEERFVSTAKAICRGERARACGAVIIDGSVGRGKSRGCAVRSMTREFNDAWWSALECDVRKSRERGRRNAGFVGSALRYAILALKSYRGDEDSKHCVVLADEALEMTHDEAAAILETAHKNKVKIHFIRSLSANASAAEARVIRTLCRCCPVDSGECLTPSLGCCYECGVSVGLNANFSIPDDLIDIGMLRIDDSDMDDESLASTSTAENVPTIAHFAGCRDQHAEFAGASKAELERVEATSTTSIGMSIKVKHLQKQNDETSNTTSSSSTKYKMVTTSREIVLTIDDIQSVAKALDEPIAAVRCGILLPCYGRSGRLSGPCTLKHDVSTRFTQSALEFWLTPANDDLVLMYSRQRPRSEQIVQRITRHRAEIFCRATQSGDTDAIVDARALGMPVIKYPLPNDRSQRAFALVLGVGVARQEKFFWLTRPDLQTGIRELENLKTMLATPPTLENYTGVPQSVIHDMSLAQVALNEEVASEIDTPKTPPKKPIRKPPASKRRPSSSTSSFSSSSLSTKQPDQEWLSSIVKSANSYAPNVAPIVAESKEDAKPKLDESTDDAKREVDDANSSSSAPPAPNTRVDVTNLSTLFQ